MIEAILFDMDGILYDSERFYMQGTVDLMRSLGYKGPEEKIYAIIGTTIDRSNQILSDLLDHRYSRKEIEKLNDDYFTTQHPLNFKSIMFEGIPEALKELHQMGKKMAVCSSSPLDLIQRSLEAMEIAQYFDVVESGDKIPHPKPAPDIYLGAAQKLQISIDKCLVYEDSHLGIEAGKAAGMMVFAREDKRFGQDQSQADQIVKNIQELVKWIRKEGSHAGSHKD